MKKVILLSGLLMSLGLFSMAQTHHPKKDSTSAKPAHPAHMKAPKKTMEPKATDTTQHKMHKKH